MLTISAEGRSTGVARMSIAYMYHRDLLKEAKDIKYIPGKAASFVKDYLESLLVNERSYYSLLGVTEISKSCQGEVEQSISTLYM